MSHSFKTIAKSKTQSRVFVQLIFHFVLNIINVTFSKLQKPKAEEKETRK